MKIGLIGTGNMGAAIIKGYLVANQGKEKDIYAYDKDKSRLESFADELKINVCQSGADVVESSDVFIVAVKPNVFPQVISELMPSFDLNKKILVSIAAGISIDYIETLCNEMVGSKNGNGASNCKVIRVMPNTPALVGKGMSALCRNSYVSDEEFKAVLELFSAVGEAKEVEEGLIDCIVGVSGSSPAYVYLFIEALADGAVAQGMDRETAYTFAAQSVLGSAEMVLKTGMHPGVLKDMVCSPNGTTIDAVASLEKNGFRNAVIEAVKVASEKSIEMQKNK